MNRSREAVGKAIDRLRDFRELAPGHRFQTRYHRARRSRETGEGSRWSRPLNVFSGLALVVAGFAFLPTPGPSYIIIVLGLWMIAGQWLLLARFFDRAETRLRKLGRWVRDRWSSASNAKRIYLSLVCVAVSGIAVYWLLGY